MKNVIIISDFLLSEVPGGAELFNDELYNIINKLGYNCVIKKSQDVSAEMIDKENFYIIANFMYLNEGIKKLLIKNENYVIVEHDHKYIKTNNPVAFTNLVASEEQIINKEFFKSAKAVLCQSKMHAEVISKNLLLKNIVNLTCNIWSDEKINLLRKNLNKTKFKKFVVLDSKNKNKGMPETIDYCKSNNIDYEIIPFLKQEQFYEELAKSETLVFFPQWMESFCRVAVEARILGCKLITNKLVGCTSESFFSLKGEELLNFVEKQKEKTAQIFDDLIQGRQVDYFPEFKLPKVSLITTIYKAGEFIKGFIDAFVNQTLENKELIIIEANSPDNEMELIKDYLEKYSNIKYIKKETQITPMEAFNEATKLATGEFIACVLVDDRMANDHLEVLAKHLFLDPTVDLVYGDCLQTTKPNETVENNSSRGRIYEHSKMQFTKENCIKSLMGPMPMYRKSMHEKIGGWDEKMKHAGDWKFMLEAVRQGSLLKKINKVVGLYYFNPNGLSTSSDPDKFLRRRKEEKEVFFEYKDIFGEKVFNTFKSYFESL